VGTMSFASLFLNIFERKYSDVSWTPFERAPTLTGNLIMATLFLWVRGWRRKNAKENYFRKSFGKI